VTAAVSTDLNTLGDTVISRSSDADARDIGTVRGRLMPLPVTMTARVFYFNANDVRESRHPGAGLVGRVVRGRSDF